MNERGLELKITKCTKKPIFMIRYMSFVFCFEIQFGSYFVRYHFDWLGEPFLGFAFSCL